MTESLDTSVIIPCYAQDRWDWTRRAIESVRSQTHAPERIVVVVDHNDELLARVDREVEGVRSVANRLARGVSGARNSGVAECDTPIVAFLDDDAIARPDWLERLLGPLADPDVVGTGGIAVPAWEGPVPRWFPPEFGWVVGAFYESVPARETTVRNVWGMSMAVRRRCFEEVGGFRTGFGKLLNFSRPEDTDFCIRVGQLAPEGRWVLVPGSVIEHRVPAARATFRFFLRRCHNEGRQKVALAGLLGGRDSLVPEVDYVRRTLPAGMAARVHASLRERSTQPLLVAGAMALGVGSAAVGAAQELAFGHAERRRSAPPPATGDQTRPRPSAGRMS